MKINPKKSCYFDKLQKNTCQMLAVSKINWPLSLGCHKNKVGKIMTKIHRKTPKIWPKVIQYGYRLLSDNVPDY